MTALLTATLTGAAARAEDQQQAGAAGDDSTAGTSVRQTEQPAEGYLSNEVVGIKPQLGVMAYNDVLGNSTSKAAAGLTIDWNLAQTIDRNLKSVFIGPSIGIIYSHLGDTGSNFFGYTNGNTSGANFLLMPLDAKVGYNFTPSFRVGAHGGGNLTYRSIASSLDFGSSSTIVGSDWRVFPNVGGDVEISLGKNSALMLRPDLTLTPGNDLFTGTVALAIPIG